ncbi:PilZ domain-containing protein [Lysinibacillus sp. BW-2-10]|uniref:PilZ domain-containing protein n=1 Tax=Lysinibacillus sp. BW-2-10 TaxID=2590030 RepID=UPI00117E7712|nr:PilZ domain-containing protein [Lysinibacillus sp. BW-2-10]TSI07394.1 PilZ domain-containing protein [Lysinibacillus sp. BW-2-10]
MKDQKRVNFKRNEGFRLIFNQPIPATFIILKISGKDVKSKKGEIQILDMSLKGAKIQTKFKLPTPNTRIEMEFVIYDKPMHLVGELVWEKQSNQEFIYGMVFDSSMLLQQQLLQELKKYAIKNKPEKK